MKECTELKAMEIATICPYCQETNDGWAVDPRGKEDECEFCNKKYKIHSDADIEYY